MTGWPQSAAHPTVSPTFPSTPTVPAAPATTPAAPVARTFLPNPSRPVLEESRAYPLGRRARSGASRRSPPLRSAGASCRSMPHAPRLAHSSPAPPHHVPALHCPPKSRTSRWPPRSLLRGPPAASRRFPHFLPIPALPLRRSASSCQPGIPLFRGQCKIVFCLDKTRFCLSSKKEKREKLSDLSPPILTGSHQIALS